MKFFSNSTPITLDEIRAAERHFGIVLPASLRDLVLAHNGATWENESGMVDSLISLSRRDVVNAFSCYELPEGYFPFADDGIEGCFALSSMPGEGVVHFDSPEQGQNMKPIADSFDKFLQLLQQEKS